MTVEEAKRIVDRLRASFSRDDMRATTQVVYVRSLSEFTWQEAERALEVAVATCERLPAIATLRRLVIEERLQLPEPMEAWEVCTRWLATKLPKQKCLACAGFGYRAGGEANRDEDICGGCNGHGEITPKRDPLPASVKRALDFVGGKHAVQNATEPGIIRAQFLKAYDTFRAAEIQEANLISLGVLEPAAARLALVESS